MTQKHHTSGRNIYLSYLSHDMDPEEQKWFTGWLSWSLLFTADRTEYEIKWELIKVSLLVIKTATQPVKPISSVAEKITLILISARTSETEILCYKLGAVSLKDVCVHQTGRV